MLRIVFIGCVQFSYMCLSQLLETDTANVVGVITRKQSKFNSDFCSLESLAQEHKIPYLLAEGNQQEDIATWLSELAPDVIYCFGWSYLLKDEILSIPRLGVIGYHPAALPENRGRHPIIWAIALGLEITASTFFFMDKYADSGDILSQVSVSITKEDNAASLYDKLTRIALNQIQEFTRDLSNNQYKRIKQDDSLSNYWRKRGRSDGQIDWRMSADSIHNLIRALTNPYVGAHCIFEENEVKVWKSVIVALSGHDNIEPGKILYTDENDVIHVKCGKGVIALLTHEFKSIPKVGGYL